MRIDISTFFDCSVEQAIVHANTSGCWSSLPIRWFTSHRSGQAPGGLLLRDNHYGAAVKVWDHTISIRSEARRTRYKDSVIINAGLLTHTVWLFAQAFYRHRQRRWRLLAQQVASGEALAL
jgi:hypothetical protein